MQWRDLLYFSSGERRALTLLLVLVLITFILIILTDHKDRRSSSVAAAALVLTGDTIRSPLAAENYAVSKSGKYPAGTVVELNQADTVILKRIPGIGPVYARRIVRYRELLGGYAIVEQLNEVYGIDDERYDKLSPWFITDTLLVKKLPVNTLMEDLLKKHPYISNRQAKAIIRLRKSGPVKGWNDLIETGEFTTEDQQRLTHYIQF